jgi:hypothetical protein
MTPSLHFSKAVDLAPASSQSFGPVLVGRPHFPRAGIVGRLGAVIAIGALAHPVFATHTATSAQPQQSAAATVSEVVFNRINAIRSSFGLPRAQRTTAYNAVVTRAIELDQDPWFAPVAGVVTEYSVWGVVAGSSEMSAAALTVVNAWVFHDGWEGSVQATWNRDCTSAGAPGCNGHRRAILSSPPVPGARLFIDVADADVDIGGMHATGVAALLIWKLPTRAPAD